MTFCQLQIAIILAPTSFLFSLIHYPPTQPGPVWKGWTPTLFGTDWRVVDNVTDQSIVRAAIHIPYSQKNPWESPQNNNRAYPHNTEILHTHTVCLFFIINHKLDCFGDIQTGITCLTRFRLISHPFENIHKIPSGPWGFTTVPIPIHGNPHTHGSRANSGGIRGLDESMVTQSAERRTKSTTQRRRHTHVPAATRASPLEPVIDNQIFMRHNKRPISASTCSNGARAPDISVMEN